MKRKTLFLVLFLLPSARALGDPAELRPRYCEEPAFLIRGEPERHESPRDEDVLNAEEMRNPELARALAARPGPYGHSELGFRYLARLFGYPGRFGKREDVEDWLVREEHDHYAQKKGLWNLWDRWVVHAPKRLSVPRGRFSALPVNGNPRMFFLDERDRYAHSRCLKVALASQLCRNYEGRGRELAEKDVVLFPANSRGAERFGYCQVRVPAWRQAIESEEQRAYVERMTGGKVTDGGASSKSGPTENKPAK
jgi:hypothetical protein